MLLWILPAMAAPAAAQGSVYLPEVPIEGIDVGNLRSLAFSPEGKMLVVQGSSGMAFVDVDPLSVRTEGPGAEPLPRGDVAFSADTKHLIATLPDGVWLFDRRAESWTRLDFLDPARTRGVIFSAAGDLLAVSMPETRIDVWDLAGQSLVNTFHVTDLRGMSFARSGSVLILYHGWGDTRFFDVRSGELLLFGSQAGPGGGLAVHPGRALAVSTAGGGRWGSVRVWNLDPLDSLAALSATGYYVGVPRISDDGEALGYESSDSMFGGVTVVSTSPVHELVVRDGRLIGFAQGGHDIYVEHQGWIRQIWPEEDVVVDSVRVPPTRDRVQVYSRPSNLLAFGDIYGGVRLVALGGPKAHPDLSDTVTVPETPPDSTTTEPTVTESQILGVYPNPFVQEATIRFAAAHDEVTLSIHNALGHRVRTLVGGVTSPGVHTAVWDGRDDGGQPVSAGVYLVRMWAPDGTRTRSLVHLH